MKVLVQKDMFAHKLCALLDRNSITNRDIFDSWFFMQKQTPINMGIVESRMGVPYTEYVQRCIEQLEKMNDKGLLQGLGELLDSKMKKLVQTKMRSETIGLLKFYKEFPIK